MDEQALIDAVVEKMLGFALPEAAIPRPADVAKEIVDLVKAEMVRRIAG